MDNHASESMDMYDIVLTSNNAMDPELFVPPMERDLGTEPDIEKNRRVVFIGNRLRDFLFGEKADAIGKYLYIDETPFLIVGVMKEKTQPSSYNQRDRDRAFIP